MAAGIFDLWGPGENPPMPESAAALAAVVNGLFSNTPMTAGGGLPGFFSLGPNGQLGDDNSIVPAAAGGLSPRSAGPGYMGDKLSHFRPYPSPVSSAQRQQQQQLLGVLASPGSAGAGGGKGLGQLLHMLMQKATPEQQQKEAQPTPGFDCMKQEAMTVQYPSAAANMMLKQEPQGEVHCMVTPIRTQQQLQQAKLAARQQAEGSAALPEQVGAGRGPSSTEGAGVGSIGELPPVMAEGFGSFTVLPACPSSSSPPERLQRELSLSIAASAAGGQQPALRAASPALDQALQQQQYVSPPPAMKQEAYDYMLNRQKRLPFVGVEGGVRPPYQQQPSHVVATQNAHLHKPAACRSPVGPNSGAPMQQQHPFLSISARVPVEADWLQQRQQPLHAASRLQNPLLGAGASSGGSALQCAGDPESGGMMMCFDLGAVDASTPPYPWDYALGGGVFAVSPNARSGQVGVGEGGASGKADCQAFILHAGHTLPHICNSVTPLCSCSTTCHCGPALCACSRSARQQLAVAEPDASSALASPRWSRRQAGFRPQTSALRHLAAGAAAAAARPAARPPPRMRGCSRA